MTKPKPADPVVENPAVDDGVELDTEVRGQTTRPEIPDLTVDDEPADATPADEAVEGAESAEAPADDDGEEVNIRDYLRQHGIDLGADGDDDAEALAGWAQKQQAAAAEQQRRLAEYQQQLEQRAQQMDLWQRQIAFQQQNPQQQTHAGQQPTYNGLLAHWNSVPEFDETFIDRAFTQDAEGNLKVREGFDPALLQKYEQYRNWQRQALSTIVKNPQQLVMQAITSTPWLHEYTTRVVQQAIAQERQQAESQAKLIQMESELFERNADGSAKLDGGRLVRTELGRRVWELKAAVQQAGEQNEYAAMVKAYDIVKNDPQYRATLAKETKKPPEGGKQKRLTLMRKHAANGNGRGGSVPRQERPAAPAQNPRSGSLQAMFQSEIAGHQ